MDHVLRLPEKTEVEKQLDSLSWDLKREWITPEEYAHAVGELLGEATAPRNEVTRTGR
jgi:hypothetical protein